MKKNRKQRRIDGDCVYWTRLDLTGFEPKTRRLIDSEISGVVESERVSERKQEKWKAT